MQAAHWTVRRATYASRRCKAVCVAAALCFAVSPHADAGNLFVTGHDPDFHALMGNTTGGQNLICRSLDFAIAGDSRPVLLLKTSTQNVSLGDHLDSELGLQASGYSEGNVTGNFYVRATATEFASIDLSQFSALFIPSDHGGTLTGDDIHALNARQSAILDYLNSGGGVVALAHGGVRTLPSNGVEPISYGFLPFLVPTMALNQQEIDFTLTPYGISLGLTPDDISGNFAHSYFPTLGGMTAVDVDASGRAISLAAGGQFSEQGLIPEPSAALLTLAVVAHANATRRRRAYSVDQRMTCC